jgi:hypothetical protein
MGYGEKKMNWEQLPNGKWRPAKKPVSKGKIDQDAYGYEQRVKSAFKKIWIYCDICKSKYCLADPCLHHLTDSPADRKRYDLYKKAEKEKASSQETTRQVKF